MLELIQPSGTRQLALYNEIDSTYNKATLYWPCKLCSNVISVYDCSCLESVKSKEFICTYLINFEGNVSAKVHSSILFVLGFTKLNSPDVHFGPSLLKFRDMLVFM